MVRATAPNRTEFRAFETYATRWSDNDCYGHMNNAVHYQYFDSAVNARLISAGVLSPERGEAVFLVAETGCRYFAELAYPTPVTVGLAVSLLGRSSVTYRLALFGGDSAIAAAEGHLVHVLVNRSTRRPEPISGALRTALEALLPK